MTAAQAVLMRAPSLPQTSAGETRGKDGAPARHGAKDSGFEEALGKASASSGETAAGQQDVGSSSEIGDRQNTSRQSLGERGRAELGETAVDGDAGEASQAVQAAGSQALITFLPPAFALALSAVSVSETESPAAPAMPQGLAAEETLIEGLAKSVNPDGDTQPAMPSDSGAMIDTLSMLGLDDSDVLDIKTRIEETDVKVTGQETHFAVSQKPLPAAAAMAAGLARTVSADDPLAADAVPISETGEEETQQKAAQSTAQKADAAAVAARSQFEGWSGGSSQEHRQPGGGVGHSSASPPQGSLAAQLATSLSQSVHADASFEELSDGLSPGHQIASRLTAELADTNRGTNREGVLKVLNIELKPANLGTVVVRIALKDDVISLRMEASQHETVAAIEKERTQLASALKSAGYVVDEITTQSVDGPRMGGRVEAAQNDASMSSSFSQSEGHGQSRSQQEFSSPGRGQGGDSAMRGDAIRLTPSTATSDNAGGTSRGRSGAIYV